MIWGSQPFSSGKTPDGSAMRALNLRCVPSIDLGALELQYFDGASKLLTRPEEPGRLPSRRRLSARAVPAKQRKGRYCGNRDLEHAKSNLCLSNDGGIRLLSTILGTMSDLWPDIVAHSGPVATAHETAANFPALLTSGYRRKDGAPIRPGPLPMCVGGGKA